jgi:hypothetical protein
MPVNQRLGLDNGQGVFPGKQSREQNQSQPSSTASSSWFKLTLQVQSQLFAEEEVLGLQGSFGMTAQQQEPNTIQKQIMQYREKLF